MTPRELVIRTLNHQAGERTARDLFADPSQARARPDDLAEIELRFPPDIERVESKFLPGRRSHAKSGRGPTEADAWGCTWQSGPSSDGAELADSPLADPANIAGYEPPAALLDTSPMTKANRLCESTGRFVLAESQARLFDRLLWLRGRQAALSDLAHGTKRIVALLDRLHELFCRELTLWAESDVDGVLLGDDFAGADGLLVDTQVWRDLFRPRYHEYCNILHARDKFVFFHSAGKLNHVFGTLIRAGIDAIGSPLLAADVEPLAHRYRGKVTFWIEIEPERARPEATPEEIREGVLRVRKVLDYGSGGVIAVGRFGSGVPRQNLAALYEQWLVPLPMHAG